MFNHNLQLLFVKTAFKFYSGVLHWFSFISNSIMRWSSRHDNFTFHANVCNLILLFSSQRYVTLNACFLENFRDQWKKVNILWGNGRRTILFHSKMKTFVFTDKQEIVMGYHVLVQLPPQWYRLIQPGSVAVSVRSIEGHCYSVDQDYISYINERFPSKTD